MEFTRDGRLLPQTASLPARLPNRLRFRLAHAIGKNCRLGGRGPIQIAITVSANQHWSLNEKEVPTVTGCVDLDLNFSPSTNLLPVRRLELAVGQEMEVRAAWLRFPSFKLEPLVQVYRRIDKTLYR